VGFEKDEEVPMGSRLFGVASLLVFGLAVASADDVRGKVKKVDADKGTITITVDDKDQTFDVPKEAKVVGIFGKKLKKAQQLDLPGGLAAIKEGANVTITTDKKDNKDVVSQVKVEDLMPKKKKKKAN
jgi:Cu/Ag efflux protein CusF